MERNFILCIFTLMNFQHTTANVEFSFKVINYSLPTDPLCDVTVVFTKFDCKTRVIVKVDTDNGPILNARSEPISGKTANTSNIVWEDGLESWTMGNVSVTLSVHNHNELGYDKMVDTLHGSFQLQPGCNKTDVSPLILNLHNNSRIAVSFELWCTAGFYGKDCSISCSQTPTRKFDPVTGQIAFFCDGQVLHDGTCGSTDCPYGYTGVKCTERDECVLSPCHHGGRCVNTPSLFTCICDTGWIGRTCQQDLDECEYFPCGTHSISCTNLLGTYQCHCQAGWTGDNCQLDVNECDNEDICRHNSTCINSPGSYFCNCTVGWKGSSCDVDLDECQESQYVCDNGGSCINHAGGYTCVCPGGWTGHTCGDDVNECAFDPCDNNSTCTDIPGGYVCTCQKGYSGIHCDVQVCTEDTCLNGDCHNDNSSVVCACLDGWTGVFCENIVTRCESDTCQNGICSDTQDGYYCDCYFGWKGHQCDEEVDECSFHPCQNNGTCSTRPGTFHCECPAGWSGFTCFRDIDECMFDTTCSGHGQCKNLPGKYHCTCQNGWQGAKCNQQVLSHTSDPDMNTNLKKSTISYLDQRNIEEATTFTKDWSTSYPATMSSLESLATSIRDVNTKRQQKTPSL